MQLNNLSNTTTPTTITADSLANSGVVIPYNAPSSAPSSAFDQVLQSVSAHGGPAQATTTPTAGSMGSSARLGTGAATTGAMGAASPLPGATTGTTGAMGSMPMGTSSPPATGLSTLPGQAASPFGATGTAGAGAITAPPNPFVSPRLSGAAAPYGATPTQGMMGGCCGCCGCAAMSMGAMQGTSAAGMSGLGTTAMPGMSGMSGAVGIGGASGVTGSPAATSTALQLPFTTPTTITQPFGPTSFAAEPAYDGYAHFHTGLDFGVPLGTPIDAAAGGRVVAAGWDSTGFGNRVIIDHGNGVRTLYGHLERIDVQPGQQVAAGQELGLSGSTGNSTGPHLHFGVQQNGQWIDPSAWLGLTPGQTDVTPTVAAAGAMQPMAPTSTAAQSMAPAGVPSLVAPATGLNGVAAVGGGSAGTTVTASAGTPDIQTLLAQTAAATGVPDSLLAGVMQAESGGDPNAVSAAGAKGLMQLMDGTAASYGVTNSFDPAQNLMGGALFLRSLLQRYGGNEQLALAAYNAGPGAVDRYGGVPPYPETQQYVQRVAAYQQQYLAAQSHP